MREKVVDVDRTGVGAAGQKIRVRSYLFFICYWGEGRRGLSELGTSCIYILSMSTMYYVLVSVCLACVWGLTVVF